MGEATRTKRCCKRLVMQGLFRVGAPRLQRPLQLRHPGIGGQRRAGQALHQAQEGLRVARAPVHLRQVAPHLPGCFRLFTVGSSNDFVIRILMRLVEPCYCLTVHWISKQANKNLSTCVEPRQHLEKLAHKVMMLGSRAESTPRMPSSALDLSSRPDM